MARGRDLSKPLAEFMARASNVNLLRADPFTARFLPVPADGAERPPSQEPIFDLSPAELVVTLSGGSSILEVQALLAEQGLCIPWTPFVEGDYRELDVQTALFANLPHLMSHRYGSWIDWVLGMVLVLADGSVAKSGSRVVKSVAGYDIHKLMVGSAGQLAAIERVHLRVFARVESHFEEALEAQQVCPSGTLAWVRARPSDWDELDLEGGVAYAPTYTALVNRVPAQVGNGGWVWREGDRAPQDPVSAEMTEAVRLFLDPTGKLSGSPRPE